MNSISLYDEMVRSNRSGRVRARQVDGFTPLRLSVSGVDADIYVIDGTPLSSISGSIQTIELPNNIWMMVKTDAAVGTRYTLRLEFDSPTVVWVAAGGNPSTARQTARTSSFSRDLDEEDNGVLEYIFIGVPTTAPDGTSLNGAPPPEPDPEEPPEEPPGPEQGFRLEPWMVIAGIGIFGLITVAVFWKDWKKILK